jgi:hypothetical protein
MGKSTVRISSVVLIPVMMFYFSSLAFAETCSGDAAKSVRIAWDGKKYLAKNIGKRTVKVFFEYVGGGGVTLNLKPGQSDYPTALGNRNYPLKAYKSPCKANY